MLAAGCTGLNALNPVCQVGSIGGSLASSGFEAVLSGISQWVASGAEWLLSQIGDVLSSTTSVNVGAGWFRTHYGQMSALAGVVILPMLLASALQAIVRQNPGQLVRTFLLQLPLALLLAVVAIQLVVLSLSATDAMSDAVAGGTSADVNSLLSGTTTGLVSAAADPSIASFVLLLVGLLLAVAAFVLWLELLIRAAAVYVAVLFLPLALATLVWPAISHWCRRLVETLAALILSKFVIVATLSLAAGAVSSGTAGGGDHGSGFSSVLAGGALLVMATFVPFAILRMIPAVEAGAVAHLDGLRARGTAPVSRVSRTAASHALQAGLGAMGDARLLAQTAAAGAGEPGGGAGTGLDGSGESSSGIPMAEGDPESHRLQEELLARSVGPRPRGPKPVLAPPSGDPGAAPVGGGLGDEGPGGEGPDGGGSGGGSGGGGFGGGSGGGGLHSMLPGEAESTATGFEPDPAQRIGARRNWGLRARIGPPSADEVWMWEGVPPGQGLIRRYEPGERRYYMGDDGGPSLKELPPAWPSGQGPGTGSDA